MFSYLEAHCDYAKNFSIDHSKMNILDRLDVYLKTESHDFGARGSKCDTIALVHKWVSARATRSTNRDSAKILHTLCTKRETTVDDSSISRPDLRSPTLLRLSRQPP